MRPRAAISFLLMLGLTAAFGNAQQGTFEIVGVVRDATGHAVPDASVRLQLEDGAQAQMLRTNSAGAFRFSGLNNGSYVVVASNKDRHSDEVPVRGARGAVEQIELKLTKYSDHAGDIKSDRGGKTAEMEFSDLPKFTVAGVTDWTAAGGHGSDTSLRTSESLTRDMLRLKAEAKSAEISLPDLKTEQYLRKQLDTSPRDLKANEELGRLYLNAERYFEAVAPLEIAYQADPTQKDNEYELALALNRSGDSAKARVHLDRLLAAGDKPEWYKLAGEVDENLGDPLGAVHAFERAVKEDPSESNYFAWGTELLEHRAVWQAKEVFESAVKAYPNSSRILTALGTALFSAAFYREAAQRLCEASDLSPNDADPYLFMGRVEIAAPDPLPCVETKLHRFVDLRPSNALANYYYAMAYWKQHGKSTEQQVLENVQKFLSKAVEADAKCSSAYLQLGVIKATQSDFHHAAEYYQNAIDADPVSTEAHYRLGVAYDRLGEKAKAAEEFHLHDELEKKQAEVVDRQRREVKQFLVLVGGNGEDK